MADGAPQAPLSSLGSFCWLSRLPACLTGRVPALTAGLRPAAGLGLGRAHRLLPPSHPCQLWGFHATDGGRVLASFFFSGGGRSELWAACPACSFPPAAMQTQPLVIPAPSPHPPLLPPGPGFGVWDGDGFGLAVFSVLRVWVLGGRGVQLGLWAFLGSSAPWGRLPSLVQDGSGVTTTPPGEV